MWSIMRPFLVNCTSQGRSVLVRFSSCFCVLLYSQLLEAKNRLPQSSSAFARLRGCCALRRMKRYTSGGIAFWCFVFGSDFLYPCTWRFRMRLSLFEESNLGSCPSLATMVAAT